MTITKILALLFALVTMAIAGVGTMVFSVSSSLPEIIKLEDFKPLLVSQVYARGGEKIGEYFREIRILVPYEKIPKRLVQAFLAAEDDKFFEHQGINYLAIGRAMFTNLKTGRKAQGASTITQQVARSLLLSSEKTYTRKIKEVLLSYKMEENLKKEEILYLYLNQIYLGEGAWGIGAAADIFFRKTVGQLTLAEAAMIAGLPPSPERLSPSEYPQRAKERQRYVLNRMVEVGSITRAEADKALVELITVYARKEYKNVAPFFVESLRQLLVQQLGEKAVLDEGLKIYTSIDYKAQQEATNTVQTGLREIDKRQGYRGPMKHFDTAPEREKFLLASRRGMTAVTFPVKIIKPDGNVEPERPLTVFHKKDGSGHIVTNIPDYVSKGQIVEGVVTNVDDSLGLTTVRFADGIGLLDIGDMGWARRPDSTVNAKFAPRVTKPSAVLREGDAILVKVVSDKFTSLRLQGDGKKKKGATPAANLPNFEEFAYLTLEQKPSVEGALLSIDQKTGEIIAMVGGYEYIRNKNELNRTFQAKRQTGSAFKTIVYAAALDKGFTPATLVQDSPLVYAGQDEGQEEGKSWKPHNHGQKFEGDILFRKALVRSLNIPTIKILEDITVPYAMEYAKRLGVFSSLNPDLSLGLGSSSLTLYEMTKVFSQFGRLGMRVRPSIVQKVLDKDGKVMVENISFDKRFEKELTELDKTFDEKRKLAVINSDPTAPMDEAGNENEGASKRNPFFFPNADQLIKPQTAYLMTTLLSAVINEEGGTAAAARALGRPAAGKTGSTNNYFDGWFLGYTPQIATGVWVGFDEEKSLGPGEVGGHTALPIWLDYMKAVHKDLPVLDFSVPPGIVFANIDGQTGDLASASSTSVVRQAFRAGTAPTKLSGSPTNEDENDFLKRDLNE